MVATEEFNKFFRIRFRPFDLIIVSYFRVDKKFPYSVQLFDFFPSFPEHSMDTTIFFDKHKGCFRTYFFQAFIIICAHTDRNIYKLFSVDSEIEKGFFQFNYFGFNINISILPRKLTLSSDSKVPNHYFGSKK